MEGIRYLGFYWENLDLLKLEAILKLIATI